MITKDSNSTQLSYSIYLPWRICFVAALFFFYEIIQLAVFNTISDDLMKAFVLSTVQLSQLSASYLYVCALFLLPAGLFLDRFSTKKLLLITASLGVLGVYLLALSSSFTIAILGRSLTGMGNAFAFLGCMRLVSRWVSTNKIALAMGLVVTIAMLGGVVAQTPFALLVNILGWQRAMFVNVVVGIAIIMLIMFAVHDAPYPQERPIIQSSIKFLQSFKFAIGNMQNWLCGLYTGLLNLPTMVLGALWGKLYLMQGKGFSVDAAGNITSLIFFGLILGAPFIGWVSDKIKNYRIPMILSAAIIFLVMITIIYIPLPFMFFFGLFLLVGILSGAQVLSYSLVSKNNPSQFESTCLGLVAIIVNVIGAISQVLFGWVIKLKWNGVIRAGIPFHSLNEYQIALVILPLAFFLSLIIAILIRDNYLIESDDSTKVGVIS